MKSFLLLQLLAITLWANAHIFVYHRFGDDRHPSTNTTIEDLRAEFEHFKKNGYEVVPLEKLVSALREKKSIPDNWVVLTIDDNFKSFYENALEVFKEYNYPFSMFVYVEATQRGYSDFLTWEQLREVKRYGGIEFHSYAHGRMTQMSNEEIKKDFDKGLAIFEKELGVKPKFFSYPYGDYSPRVKEIVKGYGFDAIVNQNMGAVSHFSDVYDLDRTALVGKSNLQQYLKYKALDANWIEPIGFPKDSTLTYLHVETNEKAEVGGVHITAHGWQEVKLTDGDFRIKLDKKLTKTRNRVVVSIGNKISTRILIKDKYGTR